MVATVCNVDPALGQQRRVASRDIGVEQVQLSSKHKTSTVCCFYVGPPSSTLAQHSNNIGPTYCVCWVSRLVNNIFIRSTNVGSMLCHRLRRWSNIEPLLLNTFAGMSTNTSTQTQLAGTMMFYCWASVADVGPTIKHHCFNLSCLWCDCPRWWAMTGNCYLILIDSYSARIDIRRMAKYIYIRHRPTA